MILTYFLEFVITFSGGQDKKDKKRGDIDEAISPKYYLIVTLLLSTGAL